MKLKYENSTSLRISRARKILAESLALEISTKCGKVIRPSSVMNFVLDHFLSPQIIDMYVKDFQEQQSAKKENKK
ncbi:hypothetical protein [Volucribacter amazonae]|uniref:Uncharacterized protein n=1 Tax=Volucribacter amazonae TaxID=256731 RepID=A0A9X4SMQ3_9PAST|nr:hypothetical protein [Volucribacter amazonae]MDG6896383.1 hypothetical protein [Volucribacter amazonae]MDG6896425.1 hypothetical protein [Volucribacter amazonae]